MEEALTPLPCISSSMALHENGKIEPQELGNGSAGTDWSRESDKEALMPESSLQIEDGLLAALNVSHR